MRQANTQAANTTRATEKVDPRFAAVARLLARHAVRKELEMESGVSQDSDSPAKDQS